MNIIKGIREKAELNAAITMANSLRAILSKKRLCVLAVPGGSSVTSIFDHLIAQDLPWDRIHLFLVDERLVSLKHKDSNSHVLKPFSQVMNEENIHLFTYKMKKKDKGLTDYRSALKKLGGRVDFALLSSGPDGHVASLFPQHPSVYSNAAYFFLVDDAPKPPKKRMSMSPLLLMQATAGMVVFFGESKRTAYERFQDKYKSVRDCPAKIVLRMKEHYVVTDL
ncbi:6-phosphogluconolactonase [Candidatus Woesearchaeota archaeon]|nr:6-phosphogluconolactonase [Candidatus Woesearchaeota archaeon]